MKYFVANWKSNFSKSEIENWLESYESAMSGVSSEVLEDRTTMFAPPSPSIGIVADWLESAQLSNHFLSAQNLSPFPSGSYTGAVSSRNFDGYNVRYAIAGHSERRRYFGETDQKVAQKVEQALAENITPIVCVDRDYVESQASAIDEKLLEKCLVAYEPLAAIGSGNNASVGDVESVASEVKRLFGDVPVLYGGSVDPQNIGEYLIVCDGVLVGTSALNPVTFAQIVTYNSGSVPTE